jgi:mannose-1-phosphate guanylyltransferase
VGFFPADHHYDDANALRQVMAIAYRAARLDPARIFLVGASPDRPETEYGWIEPGARLDLIPGIGWLGHEVRKVEGFFEKPSENEARKLLERRCLWNTFVLVGRVEAFRTLVEATKPGLYDTIARLEAIADRQAAATAMADLYATLPPSDFSRDVLTVRPDRLGVIDLPAGGWTDLGQQARVLEVMAGRGRATRGHNLAAS